MSTSRQTKTTNNDEHQSEGAPSSVSPTQLSTTPPDATFSSPDLTYSNALLHPPPPTVAMRHSTSSTSGGGHSGSGGGDEIGLLDSSSTPLLNGENIVLLSFSNDNTPAGSSGNELQAGSMEGTTVATTPFNVMENLGEVVATAAAVAADRSNAESPPPESVHSAQLTSLSPPPLSLKSSGSAASGTGRGGGGGHHSTAGSQGMFSRSGGGSRGFPDSRDINNQQQPPTVASAGNPQTSFGGGGVRQRPPLPPRWAIPPGVGANVAISQGGMTPSGAGGGVVDVLPSHLPPPKQIGSVSHRRVLSTGDASFLSNLTDPDSVPDMNESPPLEVVGENDVPAAFSGNAVETMADNNNHGGANETSGFSSQQFGVNAGGGGSRKRGVSWDFGAYAAKESDASQEEQAAFEASGLMQPILFEDEGGEELLGNASALLQPILADDDDGMDIKGDDILAGLDHQDRALSSLSLPPPPENVIGKHSPSKSVRSKKLSDKIRTSPVKDLNGDGHHAHHSHHTHTKNATTQFESEAEEAIIAALGIHNIKSSDEIDRVEQATENNIPSPGHESDQQEDEEGGDMLLEVVAPPLHRKNVSSLTNTSPCRTSDINDSSTLFEDSAWIDEYDVKGQIDGTLREEQDAKLVKESHLGDLDLTLPMFGGDEEAPLPVEKLPSLDEKVISPRPPMHPLLKPLKLMRAKTDSTQSRVAKKEEAKPKMKDAVVVEQSKEQSHRPELRHRRNKTGVKSMADELAKMASMDEFESKHTRTKTNATLGANHGIDNLCNGVGILYQGEDDDSDDHPPKRSSKPDDEGSDDEGEDDKPHDEETGEVKHKHGQQRHRAHFVSSRRSGNEGHSRSEMMYHARVWYTDLIKPKLPRFVESATHSFLFVIIPLLVIAFVLFYAVGNPLAGQVSSAKFSVGHASWSWWVLFLLRQFFILSW
eukprot:scaffold1725_cov195-Alexandrium_tamarense.AAC.6